MSRRQIHVYLNTHLLMILPIVIVIIKSHDQFLFNHLKTKDPHTNTLKKPVINKSYKNTLNE